MTNAEIAAMLPADWRERNFLDGIHFCAGLAAAIVKDNRVHGDTGQEAMSRLCLVLSQLAAYKDD